MKMEKRVAIQGFSGCFHEEAARKFYRDRENTLIRIVECATFSDLFEALEDCSADAAVMAIDKASLCFTLPHKPGSLAHILTILSFYDMNLTRIQSLPIPGKSWQYFFYIDIKFESFERYLQALSAVRPLIDDLRILGEYTAAL